jgi:hypothetical protein
MVLDTLPQILSIIEIAGSNSHCPNSCFYHITTQPLPPPLVLFAAHNSLIAHAQCIDHSCGVFCQTQAPSTADRPFFY